MADGIHFVFIRCNHSSLKASQQTVKFSILCAEHQPSLGKAEAVVVIKDLLEGPRPEEGSLRIVVKRAPTKQSTSFNLYLTTCQLPAWNKTDFWSLEKNYQTITQQKTPEGFPASSFYQVPASADKAPPPGTQAQELSSPFKAKNIGQTQIWSQISWANKSGQWASCRQET